MVMNLLTGVEFEVLTEMVMKSSVFWGILPCSQLLPGSQNCKSPIIAGLAVIFKFRDNISSENGD
jgi:hypothetical protein